MGALERRQNLLPRIAKHQPSLVPARHRSSSATGQKIDCDIFGIEQKDSSRAALSRSCRFAWP
jgi:hypothetical protein